MEIGMWWRLSGTAACSSTLYTVATPLPAVPS
ncbi:hypothetical protein PF003_g40146 [Phytophthora fragariae]|nr:hypothetical protein PF003_g40146 [Phytophthora fragariae]